MRNSRIRLRGATRLNSTIAAFRYARLIRSFFLPLALLATLPACEKVCFVADTLVATPKGPRRIADLAIGDAIYSCNPNGELVERRVVAIQRALATTLCRLTTDAGTVVTGVTPSTTAPATPTSLSAT